MSRKGTFASGMCVVLICTYFASEAHAAKCLNVANPEIAAPDFLYYCEGVLENIRAVRSDKHARVHCIVGEVDGQVYGFAKTGELNGPGLWSSLNDLSNKCTHFPRADSTKIGPVDRCFQAAIACK